MPVRVIENQQRAPRERLSLEPEPEVDKLAPSSFRAHDGGPIGKVALLLLELFSHGGDDFGQH